MSEIMKQTYPEGWKLRKRIEGRIGELEKRNEDYNKQFEKSDYKVLSPYELCNKERIDELKNLLEEVAES